jgi:hypothetical protein
VCFGNVKKKVRAGDLHGGFWTKKDPASGGGGDAGPKKPFGLQATRRVDPLYSKAGQGVARKISDKIEKYLT